MPSRIVAGRLTVVPSTTPSWEELGKALTPFHAVRVADPQLPIVQALGLFGFMACPASYHLVGPRDDRRPRLALWVYRDVARCLVCGYHETLEQLHRRLGLELRP